MLAAIPFPNLSPEIFAIDLFGIHFALRWYAMAYLVGVVIGWRLSVMALRRAVLWRNDTPTMSPDDAEDLMTWIIVGVIGGGRLGYVLFYKPAYYLAHPIEIPMVWQGGMSFHGGFIGVCIAVFFWSRAGNRSLSAVADMLALSVPPALFLGRLSNFVNGELWGRQTDLPWGVIFPSEAAQSCPDLVLACARHPSQIYEALLEGLILGALLLWLAFRRGGLRMPWFLTGVFMAGYGLSRSFVEFFRQPDAQFVSEANPLGLYLHINGYGITAGQLWSLPMIVIGLWLIWRAHRTPAA